MPKKHRSAAGTAGSTGLPDFLSSTLPPLTGKLSSTANRQPPTANRLGVYKSRLETDVDAIIASHGLTAKGLTLEEMLAAIGFPRRGDVVDVLRRKVQVPPLAQPECRDGRAERPGRAAGQSGSRAVGQSGSRTVYT